MSKTLTILIGSARGGEETWQTMYRHLLAPYNSDLALCFGATDSKESSLYRRAKYVWEIPEFENWREYYEQIFPEGWDRVFVHQKNNSPGGGIDDCTGSGAVIFAFRDFILREKKELLKEYDRIILTRSDHYYLAPHPILPLGSFHIVEGENYRGITDRHHIFDSNMAENALGICDYLCSPDNFKHLLRVKDLNPERALFEFFNSSGIDAKINRFKRVQFTVAEARDSSRWKVAQGAFMESKSPTLMLKYESEYIRVKENLSWLLWLERRFREFRSNPITFFSARLKFRFEAFVAKRK
jgi:hypothetical protein